MGKLIYSMIMSVDGYVENEHGGLDWAPDEEVNFYINQLVSSVGTYLYGAKDVRGVRRHKSPYQTPRSVET